MELISALITLVIMVAAATGLSRLWDAGYWYLVVMVTPTLFGIVYFFSPQNERDEFRGNLWKVFTLQRLRHWVRRRFR